MAIADYAWVFIFIALFMLVCCCATIRKANLRNAEATGELGGTGPGPHPASRTANNPHNRVINIETIYTPPSPGIGAGDFSAPPLYLDYPQTPFSFEPGEIGMGLTNQGQETLDAPPSYDDVIKADSRQVQMHQPEGNNSADENGV